MNPAWLASFVGWVGSGGLVVVVHETKPIAGTQSWFQIGGHYYLGLYACAYERVLYNGLLNVGLGCWKQRELRLRPKELRTSTKMGGGRWDAVDYACGCVGEQRVVLV